MKVRTVHVEVDGGVVCADVTSVPAEVVLLHGFNETAKQWDAVTAGLGDSTGWCRIDLPGHGRSVLRDPPDYTLNVATDMVAKALAAVGVSRSLCLAHSAAASVAIQLALSGVAVEELVLVSPSIEGFPFEGDFGFRLRLVRQAAASTDRNKRFLRQWQLTHGLISAMAADGSDDGLSKLFAALGGSLQFPPSEGSAWARLEEIQAEVRVIAADDDLPVYRQHHRELCRRRPAWRWTILESGGHDLPRTQPIPILAAMANWLAHQ